MTRSSLRLLAAVPALAAVVTGVAACGEHSIQLAKSSKDYQGAVIFRQHCSGCHTIDAAGTEGSATNVRTREYKDGPNFNFRKERYQQILYAIRNGGFSGGPMPQDIVTGTAAERVAHFVANNSGKEAKRPPTPPVATPQGFKPGQGSGGQTGAGSAPKGKQGQTNP